MEHINETCWVPLWQLSVWLRDEFSITKAGLDVGWVMCPSWSACKAGACGEDSQNLADRLQLHCGGGGKQDLAASTRARQPIPGHHHQLDDPWQHDSFTPGTSCEWHAKSLIWCETSCCWRRVLGGHFLVLGGAGLSPGARLEQPMWRQHQSQQAAPALVDYSLVHISAFFAIGHQPPWCSGARRDVLQRITERPLLLPCGWYWLWWGEMARGGCSVKPNRFPEQGSTTY